jgi:hypothetical protein
MTTIINVLKTKQWKIKSPSNYLFKIQISMETEQIEIRIIYYVC